MQYISTHADILNKLITVYSALNIHYPVLSIEQIRAIPASFTLECSFNIVDKKILINDKKISQEQQFVLLYLQTIELVQIYIDIYNNFERNDTDEPLVPLYNCI
ncbi:MAG: hypothetical protein WCI00_04575 [bacterium]